MSNAKPEVSMDTALRVLQHIQLNVGADRKFQQATTEIGRQLGVTHVTVHRALAVLEAQGHISVDRTTHPLTIQLLTDTVVTPSLPSHQDIEQLLNDVRSSLANAQGLLGQLETALRALTRENERLKGAAATWIKLAPHLESKMDLPQPDGTYDLILKFTALKEIPTL